MKKMLLGSILLLSATVLVACSNKSDEKSTSSSTEIIEESSSSKKATSHNLSFGESYTFTKDDMHVTGHEATGLKMTVQKPVIDENINLKEGYPETEYSKFEGKKALVTTIVVENTSSDYIDLGGWTVLDSEGKTLNYTFTTNISTNPIDGLTAGQKVTIVDVYLASDDKPVTVSYENATWE